MPSGIYLTVCSLVLNKSTLLLSIRSGPGWLTLVGRDTKRSNLTFRFEPFFANTSTIRIHSWVKVKNPLQPTGKKVLKVRGKNHVLAHALADSQLTCFPRWKLGSDNTCRSGNWVLITRQTRWRSKVNYLFT